MLRTHEGKVFSEKKIRFVGAFDLIICLKQIKEQRLLLTCAPISNVSTMMCMNYFMEYEPLIYSCAYLIISYFITRTKTMNMNCWNTTALIYLLYHFGNYPTPPLVFSYFNSYYYLLTQFLLSFVCC